MGSASLGDGQLEIMLHRNTYSNDGQVNKSHIKWILGWTRLYCYYENLVSFWLTNYQLQVLSFIKAIIIGIKMRLTFIQGPWPLNDTTTHQVTTRVVIDTVTNSQNIRNPLRFLFEFPPSMLFATTATSSQWIQKFHTEYSPLKKEFPKNLHLLTLEIPFETSEVIHFFHNSMKDRLVHFLDLGCTFQQLPLLISFSIQYWDFNTFSKRMMALWHTMLR